MEFIVKTDERGRYLWKKNELVSEKYLENIVNEKEEEKVA